MQKLIVILVVAFLAMAVAVPIFADDVSDISNGTNITNSSANDSTSGNNSSDNSSIANNSTFNTTLIQYPFKTLTDLQSKLIVLIATIGNLKTTYGNNSTVTGLLNSLTQFEKQTNSLNSQITSFMQNSTVENGTIIADTNGRLNSFIKREAALEHKVTVKQQVLSKQSSKKTDTKVKANVKVNKNSNKSQEKQNKGHKN